MVGRTRWSTFVQHLLMPFQYIQAQRRVLVSLMYLAYSEASRIILVHRLSGHVRPEHTSMLRIDVL